MIFFFLSLYIRLSPEGNLQIDTVALRIYISTYYKSGGLINARVVVSHQPRSPSHNIFGKSPVPLI